MTPGSARRRTGLAVVMAVGAIGCADPDGAPATREAVAITTASEAVTTTAQPTNVASTGPTTSSTGPTTSSIEPSLTLAPMERVTTFVSAAATPQVIDLAVAALPADVAGVVDGTAESVAARLLPSGFPVPAGPTAVISIRQHVTVGGYREDVVEIDLVTTIPLEEVIDRLRPSMEPADGFAVVVPSASTDGSIRTIGISGEQNEIGALPILDIDASEDAARPGVFRLRIRLETNRAADTLGAGVMPEPVLAELADELTIAVRMGWQLTDYHYWRNASLPNTEGRFDRTGFGGIIEGELDANVALVRTAVPGLAEPVRDGISTYLALGPDEGWTILAYDDGTLLGLYDKR